MYFYLVNITLSTSFSPLFAWYCVGVVTMGIWVYCIPCCRSFHWYFLKLRRSPKENVSSDSQCRQSCVTGFCTNSCPNPNIHHHCSLCLRWWFLRVCYVNSGTHWDLFHKEKLSISYPLCCKPKGVFWWEHFLFLGFQSSFTGGPRCSKSKASPACQMGWAGVGVITVVIFLHASFIRSSAGSFICKWHEMVMNLFLNHCTLYISFLSSEKYISMVFGWFI